MAKMPTDEFVSSLSRLESLAKGQLYHTGSGSDPGEWAGSKQEDLDEHKDGIDENGTDYTGVKKALASKFEKGETLTPAETAIVKGEDPRPMIVEKINKGEALTNAESWVLKGGYAKMEKGAEKPGPAGTPGEAKDASSAPDSHAGENENDEIEADAKKSLGSEVQGNQTLSKGLELSPFLVEFTRAMDQALHGVEARTAQRISKAINDVVAPLAQRIEQIDSALAKSIDEQGEFNKGFAETIVGIGQHVAGASEVAMVSQPVSAPKSQSPQAAPTGVQPVAKSFGPGGLDVGQASLNKSQVTNTMFELVKSGKLNNLDVIRYETTGEISPQAKQLVMKTLGGAAA